MFDGSEVVYPLPRAVGLDHEAMRTFQRLGIAAALAPHVTPYRPSVYRGVVGQPIQRFDVGPPPYPLGWAPAYTFDQPALEGLLREAVTAQPRARVALGSEVVAIEDEGDAVRFEVRDSSGVTRGGFARYLVGCDGAASFTRRRLGAKLRNLDFDEPWIVVDVHVEEEKLASLPATNVQYCDPRRPCTYVVCPGTHRRWEFLLLPDEADDPDVSEGALWRLLSPWLTRQDARIWRAASYRFHAVVSEEWRRGRVLLAGDSAHQMPPFLAQGMCQGIRDAVNLAWKLAWVIKRRAPEALLDTYAAERAPQVEETTRVVKSLGAIICERDPERAAARDEELLARQGGRARTRIRQELLPPIRHGLIDLRSTGAGKPFPQPTVRSGDEQGRMDDLLPRGFLLFAREPLPPPVEPALRELDGQLVVVGETFTEDEPLIERWLVEHGCNAALVRPDHVVYGTAAGARQALALVADAAAAISDRR